MTPYPKVEKLKNNLHISVWFDASSVRDCSSDDCTASASNVPLCSDHWRQPRRSVADAVQEGRCWSGRSAPVSFCTVLVDKGKS